MAQLDIFRISDDTELTDEELMKYIRKNDAKTAEKYQELWDAYCTKYPILNREARQEWQEDHKLVCGFAQYVVDTFEGFFLGVPVKVTSDDEGVSEYFNSIYDAMDEEDLDYSLSVLVSIFGRAYRIVYVDDEGALGSACLDPIEAFGIFDEAITPKMKYFVRTYTDTNNKRHGSISDDTTVKYFTIEGGDIRWEEEHAHGFNGVPAVEFIQNNNRTGIYESTLNLMNAYNEAISAKADDVGFYSNDMMKIVGAKVEKETIKFMRANHIVNIPGTLGATVDVGFMSKPNADGEQENLLQRLERLIFTLSMVCNISDDNFATSSGIALKYKMLPMINLASSKWRKFSKSLNQINKLICSNPVTPLKDDDWQGLKYTHILNYPANIAEEAGTASALSGITSQKTQLSVLSIVDDVDAELDQIKEEKEEALEYMTEYETARGSDMGGDVDEEEEDQSVPE